ncbi:MAG: hypothetical protein R3Y13_05245 [bacterium]
MNNYYAGPEFNMEEGVEGMTPGVEQNMHHDSCCNHCCNTPMPCCMNCQPIYECPRERVCHKVVNYNVPHIIPCNTKVINHHVYKHTYTPTYSCQEENVVSNVYDNRCC